MLCRLCFVVTPQNLVCRYQCINCRGLLVVKRDFRSRADGTVTHAPGGVGAEVDVDLAALLRGQLQEPTKTRSLEQIRHTLLNDPIRPTRSTSCE